MIFCYLQNLLIAKDRIISSCWIGKSVSVRLDIHPALEKFVNESNLFEKASYSIFKSNEFANFLKRNQITKLWLCGIDIDACVLASAFDAFDLNYEVEVLTDLSLSHSGERLDNTALEIIKKNLAKKEFAARVKIQ